MTGRSEATRKAFQKTSLYIIIISLASFALYFNAIPNEFVFDDIPNVVNNQWIEDISHVPEIFSSHLAGFDKGLSTSYYRPLVHLMFHAHPERP